MTDDTRNVILVICAVGTIVVQFWTARKPVETKIAILLWLAEFSSAAAIVIAVCSLIITNQIIFPSACAFYNFFVQGALFAMSPRPAARKDILSIVLAAVFFSFIPMSAVTGSLFKAQSQLTEVQSAEVHNEAQIVSILQKLVGMPTPSPSPSPAPHNH